MQLATCYSSFSSKSMCKTITVDGEQKGVRGGRQAYIKQSVILNYQVCRDKTQWMLRPHSLPANVTATLLPPIGWMDSASVVGCVWEAEVQRDVLACPLVSPTTPLPPPLPTRQRLTGGLSGAGTKMDGRVGGRPGMWWRSLIAGFQVHTKTTLLQYYEHFHAVTN